jgi:hypothetical protein
LDDVGEARVILDIGGDGELAAGLGALDQDRLEHGAGGIDRGGVTGGAGADDDDFGVRAFHVSGAPGPLFRALVAGLLSLWLGGDM